MQHRYLLLLLLLFSHLLITVRPTATAQPVNSYEQAHLGEHVYGGVPSYDNLRIREAYVMSYNYNHRQPNWVAYHVVPDYLKTAPHYGIFADWRVDRSLFDPVHASVYHSQNDGDKGLMPGHLAPFGITGGDRDGDKLYAVRDVNRDGTADAEDMKGLELWDYVEDADELNRIYQVNYLSNTSPMDADGFSGEQGLWGLVEQFVQQTLVSGQRKEVWVFAGPIFGPDSGAMDQVGLDNGIPVPPQFFKLVIWEDADGKPQALAFLLPHHREPHPYAEPEHFLVTVDVIEGLTGLDFFRELDEKIERRIESQGSWKGNFEF